MGFGDGTCCPHATRVGDVFVKRVILWTQSAVLSYRPGVPCLFPKLLLHLFFLTNHAITYNQVAAHAHTLKRGRRHMCDCVCACALTRPLPPPAFAIYIALASLINLKTTPGQTAPAHPLSWSQLRPPLCALHSHRQPDKTPHLREVLHHRTLEFQSPTTRRGRATRLRRAAPPAAPHAAARPRCEYCRQSCQQCGCVER